MVCGSDGYRFGQSWRLGPCHDLGVDRNSGRRSSLLEILGTRVTLPPTCGQGASLGVDTTSIGKFG